MPSTSIPRIRDTRVLQSDLVSYKDVYSNEAIVKQGFAFVQTANHDKEEQVLQTIQAKRNLLAQEEVQLVKLRNGVIVQSSDHEDWENEEMLLAEEGVKLMAEKSNKELKRKDSEEEDVRPYEMAVIGMGKSVLSAKLKKAKMPSKVKALFVLGRPVLTVRRCLLCNFLGLDRRRAHQLLPARLDFQD